MNRWNVVFLIVGLVALGWMIVHIGPGELFTYLQRVGYGFALVCAVHLGVLLLDSLSLRLCLGPAPATLTYARVARIVLAGHAINQSTPGGQLGELTKYGLLAEHVPGPRVAAGLLLQNILFWLANCVLFIVVPLAVVAQLDVGDGLTKILIGTSFAFGAAALVTFVVFRFGIGEWPFRLARWLRVGEQRVERARQFWREVLAKLGEATADRQRMFVAWLIILAGRCVSALEVMVILWLLGAPGGASVGFLTLMNSWIVGWIAAFVPMQAGAMEGSAYLLYKAAGLPPETGFVVEIVKRLRAVVFVILGVALLGVAAFRRRITS